jgi:hypothetical protein
VNPRILSGTALTGVLLAATIGTAFAQTVVPPPVTPPVAPPGTNIPVSARQFDSNHNIGHAANRAGRVMEALQRDERDYGGHRVNAINDLGNARNELMAAEQFAETHGYYGQTPSPEAPPVEKPRRHDQKRSNYSVEHAQEAVQEMLAHVQRDTRDYGGHRAIAISWLHQADNELTAAVQWDQAHPN